MKQIITIFCCSCEFSTIYLFLVKFSFFGLLSILNLNTEIIWQKNGIASSTEINHAIVQWTRAYHLHFTNIVWFRSKIAVGYLAAQNSITVWKKIITGFCFECLTFFFYEKNEITSSAAFVSCCRNFDMKIPHSHHQRVCWCSESDNAWLCTLLH